MFINSSTQKPKSQKKDKEKNLQFKNEQKCKRTCDKYPRDFYISECVYILRRKTIPAVIICFFVRNRKYLLRHINQNIINQNCISADKIL